MHRAWTLGVLLAVVALVVWRVWLRPTAEDRAFQRARAADTIAPLPAGTYEVVHGEDRLALTIPSEVDPAPCTQPPPW